MGFLTVVIWTTEALRLLFVVDAMGFDISLGISGAFFVALVASLLTAVPFTPAGLGIVEAGIVGLLTLIYHAEPTEAAAIALVDRAISVLSVVILGLIAYLLSPKIKGKGAGPDDDTAGETVLRRPRPSEIADLAESCEHEYAGSRDPSGLPETAQCFLFCCPGGVTARTAATGRTGA